MSDHAELFRCKGPGKSTDPVDFGFPISGPTASLLRHRIAELEKELAEARAGVARKTGQYLIVHKDVMEHKDAVIADLSDVADSRSATISMQSKEIVGLRAELDATRIHTIARTTELTKEVDALKAELATAKNAAKAQNEKTKRLLSEEGTYDKCGLGGISLDAAIKAADKAEDMLNEGGKITFAAACLVVMEKKIARLYSDLGAATQRIRSMRSEAVTITEMADRHLELI